MTTRVTQRNLELVAMLRELSLTSDELDWLIDWLTVERKLRLPAARDSQSTHPSSD